MFRVKIEDSIVEVCEKCLVYGEKIEEIKREKINIRKKTIEVSEELIKNYGNIIKDAREKLGIGRKEFAEKLKEKELIIKRIESNKLVPDEDLIKKIEKILGIKLKEKYSKIPEKKTKVANLTIGDIVEIK